MICQKKIFSCSRRGSGGICILRGRKRVHIWCGGRRVQEVWLRGRMTGVHYDEARRVTNSWRPQLWIRYASLSPLPLPPFRGGGMKGHDLVLQFHQQQGQKYFFFGPKGQHFYDYHHRRCQVGSLPPPPLRMDGDDGNRWKCWKFVPGFLNPGSFIETVTLVLNANFLNTSTNRIKYKSENYRTFFKL